MNYLVGVFCSAAISTFVGYRIIKSLYEKKIYDAWYNYVLIFVLFIGRILISIVFKSPMLNIIVLFLFLLVMVYALFIPSKRPPIIYMGMVLGYIIFADIFGTACFSIVLSQGVSNTLQDADTFLLTGILESIILLCTHSFFIQIIKRYRISKISMLLHLFMILLVIVEYGSIFVLIPHVKTAKISFQLLLICIGFLLVDIGVIYLFWIISENAHRERREELIAQQQDIMIKHYEAQLMKATSTDMVVHDIKKHIKVLETLISGKSEAAEKYHRELEEMVDSLGSHFKSDNIVLNAIIWDKMQICEHENIRLNLNMQDIDYSFMQDLDLTILFSNLLENAIDACKMVQKGDRYIDLRVHKFKKYVVVKMCNSIAREPIIERHQLKSTKGHHEGLGMSILTDLSLKHGGDLTYFFTDKMFETNIILSSYD